jgi:hypothetical protein
VTAFGAEASKAQTAEQMLREWLAKGPVMSDTLLDRTKEASISFATYRRVKEDVLHCRAGQYKGRWYSWLPEHEQMWELLRAQLTITSEWMDGPSSGDHASGSDAHTYKERNGVPHSPGQGVTHGVANARPGPAEPDAHSPGDLARAHAQEDSLFEHLISDGEHLATPDAQMLIAEETGASLTDQAYFDALAAEVDA